MLNMTVAQQYTSLNIMYTYYRHKCNCPVVPHVKRAYGGKEVIYHKVVYSALFRDVFKFMLQQLYIQVPQVPSERKAGRMC